MQEYIYDCRCWVCRWRVRLGHWRSWLEWNLRGRPTLVNTLLTWDAITRRALRLLEPQRTLSRPIRILPPRRTDRP